MMKRKKEQIVICLKLVLLLIQGAVHCMPCTSSCDCKFSETSIQMVECEWDNSSVKIWSSNSTDLDDYISLDSKTDSEYLKAFFAFRESAKKIAVKCQGTSYNCNDLPGFDKSEELPVLVYINSCTSDILKCLIQVNQNVSTMQRFMLYNTIDIVPDMIFNTWSGVEELIFKNTDIKMSPNMFNGTTVWSIVFDSNRINNIPNNTFDGAVVVYLEISNTNIEHINSGAFKGLDTLFHLTLRNNSKLKSLDPQLLLDAEHLVYLNLLKNRIENISKEFISNLKDATDLVIEDNLIKISLSSQLFAQTNLLHLKISNSKVDFLPEDLLRQSNVLQHFNIENNMLKHLPDKLFWNTISLRYINLSNNKIEIIPEGVFSMLPNIELIDLSYNDIFQLNTKFFIATTSSMSLLLDFNKITALDLSAFAYCTCTFDILSIASNKIKKVNTTDVWWTARYMDLSDNDITVFGNWSNVGTLNLTGNKINTIKEIDVNAYVGATIDFRDNNISSVIRDSNSPLKDVTWSLLYMANNPLEPSCQVTTTLKGWNMNGRLLDHENITFSNGEYLLNTKLYSVCDTGDIEIALIGSSAVGALITLIIVVSIIRHRNGIWKYISNICNRKKTTVKVDEIRLNQSYTYDIFISFAYQDGDFVIDDLLPNLESNFHQKVCVHFRDWTVGELIPDQIIKSVESSRMTIIILTEHFLDSEWSQLEFLTAHNLAKQERRSRLIIVIKDVDIINNEKLTPELKSYIVISKYLLWGDLNFWKKLQEELPRESKNKFHTTWSNKRGNLKL